jgi:hypothetical protein
VGHTWCVCACELVRGESIIAICGFDELDGVVGEGSIGVCARFITLHSSLVVFRGTIYHMNSILL